MRQNILNVFTAIGLVELLEHLGCNYSTWEFWAFLAVALTLIVNNIKKSYIT